jgi:hypothetical protein
MPNSFAFELYILIHERSASGGNYRSDPPSKRTAWMKQYLDKQRFKRFRIREYYFCDNDSFVFFRLEVRTRTLLLWQILSFTRQYRHQRLYDLMKYEIHRLTKYFGFPCISASRLPINLRHFPIYFNHEF